MSDHHKVLKQRWVVVCPPWGDGTVVNARVPDAGGDFVCDALSLLDEADLNREETAQQVAEHICEAHNTYLATQRDMPPTLPDGVTMADYQLARSVVLGWQGWLVANTWVRWQPPGSVELARRIAQQIATIRQAGAGDG